MATNTRVAMTIAAKYVTRNGAVEAFYLDGRMNGKREQQYADLTVDRSDRGAFYALYASSHGSTQPADGEDGNRRVLDRIGEALKNNHRQNIDYQINELAEGAVNVVGRLTLSNSEDQKPYFAGMIIKDGELAAVTVGSGCAYLYRDDAVFPLTEDDYPLEAIDTLNRQVSGFHDFSAGVAGSIRYSNIAQLRPDDCIILCNCALMETIGQKVLLQLLDEAEDQADAVGLIMSEATHRNPDVNYQIMIGFIEEVTPLDRVGRNTLAKGLNLRDTLGRMPAQKTGPVALSKGPRNTGTLTPEERAKIAAAVAQGAGAAAATPVPDPNKPSQLDRDDWKKDLEPATAPTVVEGEVDSAPELAEEKKGRDTTAAPVETAAEKAVATGAKGEMTEPESSAAAAADRPTEMAAPALKADDVVEMTTVATESADRAGSVAGEDLFDEIQVEDDRAVKPVSGEAAGDAETVDDSDDWTDDDLSYSFAGEYETGSLDEPEETANYEDPILYAEEKKGSDKGKRIAIAVLLVIALILIGFIAYTLLKGRSAQSPGTEPGGPTTAQTFPSQTLSSRNTGEVISSVTATITTAPTTAEPTTTTTVPPTTTTTTEATTEAETTAAKPAGGDYTIKEGDNLWDIVTQHYPDADPISKMNEVAKANGFSSYEDVILTPGNNFVLP